MTRCDAAYGPFEEGIKGSITEGKMDDFTIFDQDLRTLPEETLLDTQVEITIFNGQVVYSKKTE